MANDDDAGVDATNDFNGMLPTGFGKQDAGTNAAIQIEKSRRPAVNLAKEAQPAKATNAKNDEDGDDNDDDDYDDDDDDDDDEEDEFPVSHELVLNSHERAITSMTLDNAGGRLITGSTDCTIKFHDFSSMTPNTLHSFKSIEPTASKHSASAETHPINHVEFNPNSPSRVLVVPATSQAKIFSRDGTETSEMVKGDMYLRDLHNTKGHTAMITCGTWHPTNKDLFVTAGLDGTLRIWDVKNPLKQKTVIVHKSKAAGSAGRSQITAVAWKPAAQGDGTLLAAAALDGSLILWDEKTNYTRPLAEIREAHKPGTWTGGLDISSDGRTIVSRGGDDTIKLWDTRKFKSPISTVTHVSTYEQFRTSNIVFSPNSSSIITGSQEGNLHILNPATLKPEFIAPMTPNIPLITVHWHPTLNQILTGSANGALHILFSPSLSTKGALMVLSKAPKRRHIDDIATLTTDTQQSFSGDSPLPHSRNNTNPAGVTQTGRSRDPRRPHIPQTTPFAKSQPDEAHIRNNIPLSSMRDEDPREALLKYAEKAQKDPMFTNAWKDTQPKTIYADLSDDEEGEPQTKKARQS